MKKRLKRALPLGEVYRFLETGPVVLLTTARQGRANVMAMSWHTMMEFEPPLIGCVVSERDHSFAALKATRECVINIPTARLLPQTVACGNCSGARVDKFAEFGLTPLPASKVAAPLVAECPVNVECRVVDTRFVKSYDFFVLEAVKAWIDGRGPGPGRWRKLDTIHHMGMGRFMVAGRTVATGSRMP
ncbi:MAG: flavin reductase family protein [Gemmatimonadota bacterium]|nr:flavin reductase family protein [Gemmatimonadota bacterium]